MMAREPFRIAKLPNSLKSLIKWSFIRRCEKYWEWLEEYSGKKRDSWTENDLFIVPEDVIAELSPIIEMDPLSLEAGDSPKEIDDETSLEIANLFLRLNFYSITEADKQEVEGRIPRDCILAFPTLCGIPGHIRSKFGEKQTLFCNYFIEHFVNKQSDEHLDLCREFHIKYPLNPRLYDVTEFNRKKGYWLQFLSAPVLLRAGFSLSLNQILSYVRRDTEKAILCLQRNVDKDIKELEEGEPPSFSDPTVVETMRETVAKTAADSVSHLIMNHLELPFDKKEEKGFAELKLRDGSSFPDILDEIKKRFCAYDIKKEQGIGYELLAQGIRKDPRVRKIFQRYRRVPCEIDFTKSNVRFDVEWVRNNLANALWQYI